MARGLPLPGVRPSDLFPTLLFRSAAFLAKLYSEAIVLPTVEVSISAGKGGLVGEPGRGLHSGRRLAHASRDGGILRITLDRPARRNSLTRSMIATFVEAF